MGQGGGGWEGQICGRGSNIDIFLLIHGWNYILFFRWQWRSRDIGGLAVWVVDGTGSSSGFGCDNCCRLVFGLQSMV